MKQLFSLIYTLFASALLMSAQTSSDSIVQKVLEQEGVRFSDNNSVVLLLNGQEKFDDMFAAIRKAKESIHLE